MCLPPLLPLSMRGRDTAVWSADGVLPGAGDGDGGAAVGAAAVF